MAQLELISAHMRALREGDDATKTEAARALRNLASGVPDPWRANRVAIANAGGIAPLVELLRAKTLVVGAHPPIRPIPREIPSPRPPLPRPQALMATMTPSRTCSSPSAR